MVATPERADEFGESMQNLADDKENLPQEKHSTCIHEGARDISDFLLGQQITNRGFCFIVSVIFLLCLWVGSVSILMRWRSGSCARLRKRRSLLNK